MLPPLHVFKTSDSSLVQIQEMSLELFEYENQFAKHKAIPEDSMVHFIIRDEQHGTYGALTCLIRWDAIWINNFFVKEKYRKQGIGKQLLDEAIRLSKNEGCRFLFVETISFHHVDFYRKNGFEEITKVCDYPKGYDYFLLKREV